MSLLHRIFGAPEAADLPATPAPAPTPPGSPETATVRRIVAELEAMPPERARFVAASGYVLARVANADLAMSDVETTFMEQALQVGAGVSEAEAVLVVESAKQQARLFGSTEDYLVTREFLRISNAEARSRLLRGCFMAAAADASISSAESATLNEIANELQIPAAELSALREEFGDRMSVVQAIRAQREAE